MKTDWKTTIYNENVKKLELHGNLTKTMFMSMSKVTGNVLYLIL